MRLDDEREMPAKPVIARLVGLLWAQTKCTLPATSVGMPLAFFQRSSVPCSRATLNELGQENFPMTRFRYPTLLDLIQAVQEVAANEQETVATVVDLINSGQVRLCGDFAGATIDLSATVDAAA
jgi:hypothetical protein